MPKPCLVESCDKPVIARGCCPTHYTRLRRTGSPHPAPRRGVRPVEDRFWEKVDKTGACWNWTASRSSDGYGNIRNVGGSTLAHRIAWEMANGPIPDGIEIDHVCHNRACVNVSHMRLASRAENNQNLSGKRKNNSSGHRGVSWHEREQRWRVQVQVNKANHYVGAFRSLEEAAAAAAKKRKEVFAYNHADQ